MTFYYKIEENCHIVKTKSAYYGLMLSNAVQFLRGVRVASAETAVSLHR